MNIQWLRKSSTLFFVMLALAGIGQPRWNGARIQHELEKLNTVGNALYLAAHPDDENTRLIAWLANEKKVRTAYLSLTRGDGGQNLIGDEKGALMGLIRTQELREARKLDGGEQLFTRALDFGYSKTSDETLEKWNRDSIFADVVMTIRKFKPDVIVLRFPPNNYAGHGHHSASAILAEEAFNLTADASVFPASAKKYGTWQAKRIFFNDSPWWDKEIDQRKEEYVTVDVGTYNPLLGRSYTEIAGLSRSRHSSQGFGAALAKGEQIEYLKLRDGEPAQADAFKGVDLSWKRIKGGEEIAAQLTDILNNYDAAQPQNSLKSLADLYDAIRAMPDNDYKAYKLEQLREIIAACGGFWYELLAEKPLITRGTPYQVTLEALSQQSDAFTIKTVRIGEETFTHGQRLSNAVWSETRTFTAGKDFTNPYWLSKPPVNNMFTIENKEWLGLPQNPAWLQAEVTVELYGTEITYPAPLTYKHVDRALGELYREVQIVPEITATPDAKTVVFTSNAAKTITIKVQAGSTALSGITVQPNVPPGWSVKPASVKIDQLESESAKYLSFTVKPGDGQGSESLSFNYTINGETALLQNLVEIVYPHIETQVVLNPTVVKLVSAPAKIVGSSVGYIVGAGDEVPDALAQLGYDVTFVDPERATLADLNELDAVVVGIRAFNKVEAMKTFNTVLNEYVKAGGTVVVQYNTNRGMKTEDIGPYPISLTRGRVTVEEAPVTLLEKDHPIFQTPNKISMEDFEYWVQERGLYFAGERDDRYTALLSWNDPGEEPLDGSLLVTEYGKGTYVLTGISFFRQLPAGVPGAFRLFANLVSYKQQQTSGKE